MILLNEMNISRVRRGDYVLFCGKYYYVRYVWQNYIRINTLTIVIGNDVYLCETDEEKTVAALTCEQ